MAPGSSPSTLQRPLLLQMGRHTWAAKERDLARASDPSLGFISSQSEEGHEDKDPASVSHVFPQVQVLLYYLQHPPISFAELKRNTLYFSTDV